MAKPLRDLLTAGDLLDLSGPASYARGAAYAEESRVTVREVDDQHAEALVRGTEAYRVQLAAERGRLAWSCNCPIGVSGDFCKHAVAVAITITRDDSELSHSRAAGDIDLEVYLASLEPHELTALILEQAAHDPRLYDRLTARAAAKFDVDASRPTRLPRPRRRAAASRSARCTAATSDGGWTSPAAARQPTRSA